MIKLTCYRIHSHKHDKTKCAICMAKEQKVLLKKKTSPKEESKKMISMKNLTEPLQPPEIHEEEEESAKSFEKYFSIFKCDLVV